MAVTSASSAEKVSPFAYSDLFILTESNVNLPSTVSVGSFGFNCSLSQEVVSSSLLVSFLSDEVVSFPLLLLFPSDVLSFLLFWSVSSLLAVLSERFSVEVSEIFLFVSLLEEVF